MATLSNRIFYQDGKTPADSAVVGFENQRTRVVRYDLNLDEGEQGNRITVVFGDGIELGAPYEYWWEKINQSMSFYFAISTDPEVFANAGYADISSANGKAIFTQTGGDSAEQNIRFKVKCEANISLYPGVQYYFWVFPGFSSLPGGNYTWGWVYWSDVPIDVTLSGNSGLAWVKKQDGWKIAVPYVRKDGSWKPAIPYVRKNGEWKIGSA